MNDLNRLLQDRVAMRVFVGFYLTIVLVLYGFTHSRWGLENARYVLRNTPYEDRINRNSLALYGNPVEQALVRGEILAGDSVASFKAKYGVVHEFPLGRYTRIWPGRSGCGAAYVLYAKDGYLVVARSQFGFNFVIHFDTLTPDEWAEVEALEDQERKDREAAYRDSHMAVAGFAALKDPCILPNYDAYYHDLPDELP